jgi:hypothetical protein
MTEFEKRFQELNAPQIKADRSADRIFSVALILALILAAGFIGLVLSAVAP